jgi:hypothetical protein
MRAWWFLPAALAVALCLGNNLQAGGGYLAGGCAGCAGPLGPCYPGWEPDPWAWTPWPPGFRLFPYGGYTAYAPRTPAADGTLSPYHQLTYSQHPAETARLVRERLTFLGIPPVLPEPEFLGKNPYPPLEVFPLPPRPKEEKDADKKPEDKGDKPDDKSDKPDDKKEKDKKDKEDKKDTGLETSLKPPLLVPPPLKPIGN